MNTTDATKKPTPYRCATCGSAVLVGDGLNMVRQCLHVDAPVIAAASSSLRGTGGVKA
jgi:hypothetical protein